MTHSGSSAAVRPDPLGQGFVDGHGPTLAPASYDHRMRRVLGAALALVVGLVAVVTLVRLAGPADNPAAVRRQLAHLRAAIDDGAATDAQALFPEGYFFLHVLYGLTQVDVGRAEPPGERSDELREARWALAQLESPAGRAPFDPDLDLPYGVFFRGWTNWLRGGVVSMQVAPDPGEVARFEADSAELAAAFGSAGTPYLVAYPGQSWPCDSAVAIASLRLHDALRPPRYGPTVDRWLTGVRERLDPATGLMPHRADAGSGAPIEVARATSQSIIQRFLVDIDPGFARSQYLLFRSAFRPWGPAIREYPAGVPGSGDVDSGPLLLGISLSATVVTMGAARVQGDDRLAGALARLADVAGLPLDTFRTRRYAFGVLPIGDAFVAWSKTAQPWVSDRPEPPPPDLSRWWRLPLLIVLLAVGALPLLFLPVRRSARRVPAS